VTFPPDGITGHDDHRAISRWTTMAVRQSPRSIRLLYAVNTVEQYEAYLKTADEKFNLYFNIREPVLIPQAECDLYLSLPKSITSKKLAALKAMPSQYGAMFEDPDHGWIEGALCSEAFVLAERDIAWS
jgi:LmbE family N-acetylglucosaminyl deacetylase